MDDQVVTNSLIEREVGSPSETPVFFTAGAETLFGIVTHPSRDPLGSAVVCLAGGATPLSTNRNRLSVRLCRGVASLGYHGFRLDYHGAGESTGMVESLRLDRPFDGDVGGALDWLQGYGIRDFVLVGSCIGARAALAEAAVREQVRRLILVSVPVRDMATGDRGSVRSAQVWSVWRYVRKALEPRILMGWFDRHHRHVYWGYAREKGRAVLDRIRHVRPDAPEDRLDWVSPRFLRELRDVTARGTRVLFIFGEQDGWYADFVQARSGELGHLIDSEQIEVRVHKGQVHGFTRLDAQETVLEEIFTWLRADRELPDLMVSEAPNEGARMEALDTYQQGGGSVG
jgi:pimeloyl-ACP methyl ester carboxylesterase